ncbi:hypothetical protein SLS62_008063 [Diatrype stigma]|uniref:Uncharacterized protein n=1 Tax=Diatrype stigma TaxID=117547 RepID=A0AAN9UPV3_9PEZI
MQSASDTMSLLYLVPAISSTCSLFFAWDQFVFLRLFLKKDVQPHGNRLQSSYWKSFFPQAVVVVFAGIGTTAGASFTLMATQSDILLAKGTYNWYLAGAVLAIAHLPFAPTIMPTIKRLQDPKKDVDSGTATLQKWLRIHTTRALTVDLGSWICCVVAATKTLSPQ